MQISVIGANKSVCSTELYEFAVELGHAIANQGHIVFNGGMEGVMEAVSKGVQQSNNAQARVIGILPYDNKSAGNSYLDIVIPTGIGFARNMIVVSAADVIIALGGGAGTLNEISYAWQLGKKVYCYQDAGGWSAKLAGQQLDARKSGLLIGFNTIDELLNYLKQ